MTTPIIPSPKLRTKQQLKQYVRDVYAGYTPKTHVNLTTTTKQLHQASSINITAKRFVDRKGYFYRAYIQKKPSKFMAWSHPVFMQRKQQL